MGVGLVAWPYVRERTWQVRSSVVNSLIELVVAVILASTAVGCTDPMAPHLADVQGTWVSTDFTYDLTQSQDEIGGVAVCTIESVCYEVVDGSGVHGSVNDSAVQMSFAFPPGVATFAGAMISDSVIVGTLTTDSAATADTLRRFQGTQTQRRSGY